MSSRNFGLDFVRALSIALVLLSHSLGLSNVTRSLSALGINSAAIAWSSGVCGVEIFFCLSGFLIGSILIDLLVADADFSAIVTFVIRRWMRTLPLYYLVLIFIISVFGYHELNGQATLVSYFFLSQNLVGPMPAFWYPVSWSLVIEEWSYLVIPFLAFYVFRRTAQPLMTTALTLIVAGFCFRLLHLHDPQPWDDSIRKTYPTRMDAIVYGLIAAQLYRSHGPKLLRLVRRFSPLIVTVAIYDGYRFSLPQSLDGWYGRLFIFPTFDASVSLLVLLALGLRRPAIAGRFITEIATLSYALYLAHFPLIGLIPTMPALPQLVTFLGASGLSAVVLSYLVEQPIMRLRPILVVRSARATQGA